MKTLLLSLLTLWLAGPIALAQGRFNQRMEERKREFINERMNLPNEKEEAFWKLVDALEAGKKDLRIEMAQNRMSLNKSNLSEKEAQHILDRDFALKRQLIDYEKSSYDKMIKLVGAQNVVTYTKAEQDFNRMIINRIADPRLREEN
jgi:hypothetical protein